MSTFQRVLLYAGMAISVVVLVLGVAGIIAAWAYNAPATEAVLSFVMPAKNVVQRLEAVARETGTALDNVSSGLGQVETRIEEVGVEVLDSEIAVEAISAILGQDIQPLLDEAAASFRAVYDLVGSVEEAITTFNSIPLIDLQIPGSEELAQLRDSMVEVAAEVTAVNEDLQERKTEIVTGAVEEISTPINRIDARVGEIRSNLADFETRAGIAHEQLSRLEEQVPFWIDLISIVITLLLIWLIISQVAMFVLCRKTLQGKVA